MGLLRDYENRWIVAALILNLHCQDILNILFHYYPDMLYELPCEWNYRVWQCSQVRTIYTHIYSIYTHIYTLPLQYLHTAHCGSGSAVGYKGLKSSVV